MELEENLIQLFESIEDCLLKRRLLPCLILLYSAIDTSGSGSTTTQTPLQGSWEASMPDLISGQTEYFDVDIAQSGSSLSSLHTFVFFLGAPPNNSYSYCTSPSPTFSAVANGNQISGTTTTCYGTAAFSGTISNSNSIVGTYTSSAGCGPSGNQCVSGTFIAQKAAALAGNYSGALNFSDGTVDNVSVTVSETSGQSVTATGTVTGADAGSINLSGYVVGNAAAVQGTVSGQSSSLYAWSHSNYLYVVDQNTGGLLGQLSKQ